MHQANSFYGTNFLSDDVHLFFSVVLNLQPQRSQSTQRGAKT
jgi:hypothetical protein